MRYRCSLLALLAVSLVCVGFTSCEKDNGDNDEYIEIRLRNDNNGGGSINLLWVDSACHHVGHNQWSGDYDYWEGADVNLSINASDNFVTYSPWSSSYGSGDIVCVGDVSNIGKIKNIPSSGWTKELAVRPGKGYIVRHMVHSDEVSFCKYARIYVVEYLEGANSGGIIGAVVRYQDNWKDE